MAAVPDVNKENLTNVQCKIPYTLNERFRQVHEFDGVNSPEHNAASDQRVRRQERLKILYLIKSIAHHTPIWQYGALKTNKHGPKLPAVDTTGSLVTRWTVLISEIFMSRVLRPSMYRSFIVRPVTSLSGVGPVSSQFHTRQASNVWALNSRSRLAKWVAKFSPQQALCLFSSCISVLSISIWVRWNFSKLRTNFMPGKPFWTENNLDAPEVASGSSARLLPESVIARASFRDARSGGAPQWAWPLRLLKAGAWGSCTRCSIHVVA